MINCLLVPEWWEEISDAVYVVVGAVLGVISSLLISWGAKKYGIHRLKKMLRVELEGIKQALENNKNSEKKLTLSSPIWNFIGQTSTLLDLKEKDYKKIVAIHGAIIAFKENEDNSDSKSKLTTRERLLDAISKNSF